MSEVLTAGRVAARRVRPISPFEFLPGWIVYGPVVLQWIALGLWYRDFSLPTAANPAITTGGLCGERKAAILDLVQGEAQRFVAPYVTVLTGANDMVEAEAAMAQAGLALPIVVKPDIGCNGTGVRLVRNSAALATALAAFPRGVTLVLQAYVAWEGEAGIFYVRHPDDACGRITSVTLKHAPEVMGDGVSTLGALIRADARHGQLQHLYLERLAGRLHEIPAAGAPEKLVFAGNHCKGSIFENGAAEITPALTARIETLARAIPDFHFGRFDVRFANLGALRRGENFAIIEINGVGSEATHIWDPSTPFREVFSAQFFHYGKAFAIGAAMRRRGARSCGLRAMAKDWFLQRRLMRSYPLND